MEIFDEKETKNIIEYLKDQLLYYASMQADTSIKLDLIMMAVPEIQGKLDSALREILESYTTQAQKDNK